MTRSPSRPAIRIAIHDPSELAGQLLSHVISADGRFDVAGIYRSPHACIDGVIRDRIDVLVTDFTDDFAGTVEMVRQVAAGGQGPIVLALANDAPGVEDRLREARKVGLTNHILRPPNVFELERIGKQIVTNAAAACMIRNATRPAPSEMIGAAPSNVGPALPSEVDPAALLKTVVMAYAGSGAISSLGRILPMIRKGPARIVVVVLHDKAPTLMTDVQKIGQDAGLPVQSIQDGDRLGFGRIYLASSAPDDIWLQVDPKSRTAILRRTPAKSSTEQPTPSFDRLATEAASVFGRNVSGLALSAAGQHGLAGLKAILERGGTTFGEDPSSAESPSLVAEAQKRQLLLRVLKPAEMAQLFAAPASAGMVGR